LLRLENGSTKEPALAHAAKAVVPNRLHFCGALRRQIPLAILQPAQSVTEILQ